LAARERVYGGRASCEECHPEQVKKLGAHAHKSLSCEGCHGPLQAHVDDPDDPRKKPPKLEASHCVRCHEANPSRPKWQKQVVSKKHNPGSLCKECHVPHAPDESP
jgi:hypothetical protein